MNNTLRNIIISVLLAIVAFLGGEKVANLGGGVFATEAVHIGSTDATSTPNVYLTAGAASTTFKFPCENAEQIDLNLGVVASTTASKIQWDVSFSNDESLYYFEDGRTVDSAVAATHGAYALIHSWTPASTATTTKNITITPVASKYCQIRFAAAAGNAGILGSAILKVGY